MSDPLSVAASITGLIGITVKIAQVAKQLYDSAKDAPNSVLRLKDEMDNLNMIFCEVQALTESVSRRRHRAKKSRLSMVPLHHLLTILTGCMLYYSSLDERLRKVAGIAAGNTQPTSSLSSASRVVAQIKWSVWTEAEVAVIFENLERHKTSLIMMLTILNWYVSFLMSSLREPHSS